MHVTKGEKKKMLKDKYGSIVLAVLASIVGFNAFLSLLEFFNLRILPWELDLSFLSITAFLMFLLVREKKGFANAGLSLIIASNIIYILMLMYYNIQIFHVLSSVIAIVGTTFFSFALLYENGIVEKIFGTTLLLSAMLMSHETMKATIKMLEGVSIDSAFQSPLVLDGISHAVGFIAIMLLVWLYIQNARNAFKAPQELEA